MSRWLPLESNPEVLDNLFKKDKSCKNFNWFQVINKVINKSLSLSLKHVALEHSIILSMSGIWA